MPSMGSSLLILELLLLLLIMLANGEAISLAGCAGEAARSCCTDNVDEVALAPTEVEAKPALAAKAGGGADIDIGAGNELRDPRDI